MSNTNESKTLNKKWELVNFCEFDKYATKSYCAIHNVDESKNLGDITKVDENELDDFNMICGGSPCFVEGTLVLTELGYKPIEEIEIGDVVYTKEKRWKKIKRIGSDGEKEICSIAAMGMLPIECTLNHPFWIKHKCRKWNNNIRRYEYYLSDAEKVYAANLTTNDFIGIPIISDKDNELYKISDELLWLLGRFVADGVISDSEVILSIGMDKISDFDRISIYHRIYKHTKSCYRVVFNKTSELYHFVSKYNFGKGAINKNIPVEILELPKEKLKIFLDGYWSGDGCSIKDTVIRQATTISRKLALMLVLAVQKVYSTGCKVYFDKRPDRCEIEGRIVNQNDTYMVRFLTENLKSSFFVENDFVWYPIKNIKKEGLKKVIYNIEVEDDHTYIANGATVFNCQDFSVVGKQKGSVWTCKDCGEEYNPLTVHWSKRDCCPNCGSKNIEKTRSSLLVEYLRVIRANKPNFGIYENVKNIVGKQFKDTTFKLFTDELEEYGYNVYWKVLNSKNYGIPQNRERVYLIFIKKDLDNGKFKFPEPFDNGLRLKDLLEDEVDERFYISDEKVERFITNLNDKNSLLYDPCQVKREGKSREYSDYAPTLTSRDYKDPRLVNENAVKQVGNISDCNGNWNNPQVGRVYDTNGCSPTLNTCSGGGHEPKVITCLVKNKGENFTKETEYANTLLARDYEVRNMWEDWEVRCSSYKLELERQFIDEFTSVMSKLSYQNTQNKKRMLDMWRTDERVRILQQALSEIQELRMSIDEKEKSKVSNLQKDNRKSNGMCGIRIRKLTPRETFRLMGFSDENFDAAQKAGVSNSQLYKQAGNSIVVDVLYYIYVELYKAMPYLFDNLKLSSFFSGIGAFEIALDRLYKDINSGNFINPQTE